MTSDLRAAGLKVRHLGDWVVGGMSVIKAIEEIKPILTQAMEQETPVDTGALKDSTKATVFFPSGETLLEEHQDAQSKGGLYYGQFVIHGHRIVAWGHDTGRMQPPNDYPERALEMIRPEVDSILEAAIQDVGTTVAMVLK